jgi:predicted MPP superfamily phosphohydrolase
MRNSRLIFSTVPYFFMAIIVNYAVFSGFSFTFNIPQTWLYYTILLVLSLSHPVSILLLTYSSKLPVRALYAASAAWTGVSVYILILFAVYLIVGRLVEIPVQTAGILIVLIASLISAYALFNVTRLKVEKLNIPLNIEEDIRAVQISDVHIGPVRKERFIKGMVDKIIDLNPDIVFITGDLFDGSSKLGDDILKDFNRIEVPVLFVMGNHDYYHGEYEISNFIKATHINILDNEISKFKGLQIVGIPFSWGSEYLPDVLARIYFDENKPTILLYHVPVEFKEVKEAGIDLFLSGHTHAGQFFPFTHLIRLAFPHSRGLYEDQGAYLYVSHGTGTLGPPMRLCSRCEITLINLCGKKSTS